MNPSFWRRKKVLITGHTGFKGSWLSLWLQSVGADVIGYALEPTTSPNMFEQTEVGQGMESVIGDIRDSDHLGQTIKHYRPPIVFHMAAQALVRKGYQQPTGTFDVNVRGTSCLLDAVRQSRGVRAVVVVTSDKCYRNSDLSRPFKETDELGGYDPYSSSKACAELVVAAYRSSFFSLPHGEPCHVATVRAGNVIGGGDWADDRLLPDTVRAIIGGKPLAIRNPKAIRPWQHVLEPLGGYLLLAEKLWDKGRDYAEAWNFGPLEDDTKPVEHIIKRVIELWGEGCKWSWDQSQHPPESEVLRLDCTKARQRLQWEPRWRLEETLKMTVGLYKASLENGNMRAAALRQIESYQDSRVESHQ